MPIKNIWNLYDDFLLGKQIEKEKAPRNISIYDLPEKVYEEIGDCYYKETTVYNISFNKYKKKTNIPSNIAMPVIMHDPSKKKIYRNSLNNVSKKSNNLKTAKKSSVIPTITTYYDNRPVIKKKNENKKILKKKNFHKLNYNKYKKRFHNYGKKKNLHKNNCSIYHPPYVKTHQKSK